MDAFEDQRICSWSCDEIVFVSFKRGCSLMKPPRKRRAPMMTLVPTHVLSLSLLLNAGEKI